MKDTLKLQLDVYKKLNTKESKETLLTTINSMVYSFSEEEGPYKPVHEAKDALTSSTTNKEAVVNSVESVISSLK